MADFDQIAVEHFCEYLRIKTVQPNPDYASCMKFLEKVSRFQREGHHINLIFVDGCWTESEMMVPGKPLFVMTWEGSSPSLPSILLNSHTDVVPVFQDKWDRDAFDARVDEEGKIVARGAQDMKCVGIGYIEAIRRLIAAGFKPERTFHLSFVPDEEIGGTDGMASFIISADFQALNIGMALDEGIPSPFPKVFVFNQERVPWWFTIVIKGVTGHGSGLPQGTAAEKLHTIMGSIFKFREEQTKLLMSYDGRIGEVTSINITKLSGGVQTNVIPETISITVDARISPNLGTEAFSKLLAEWTDLPDVEVVFEQKAEIVPASPIGTYDKFWPAIESTFRSFSQEFSIETFPGATDSRFIRGIGVPAYGISPFTRTPILLHDHNEFLRKDEFLRGVTIYEALIKNLASA